MAAGKTEQVPLSTKIGGQLQVAEDQSVITDTIVAANATVTLLKAALVVPLGSDGTHKSLCQLALQKGVDLSLIAETHTATTVAELIAFTDAAVGEKPGFFN